MFILKCVFKIRVSEGNKNYGEKFFEVGDF
jgi:hypothetical protein